MAASLLFTTVIIPLFLGVILSGSAIATSGKALILTALTLLAALLVYFFLEGLPPVPPVSSKHKIFFVFLVLGLVGVGAAGLHKKTGPLLTKGVLLAALFWIGQRKIMSDPFQLELFLALLPVIGAGIAATAPTKHTNDPFLWPVALLSLAISGSLVSVFGGYIGLAQMLGAFAALTGGILAVAYLVVHILGRHDSFPSIPLPLWSLTCVISAILISVAVFASKLSTPAFVLVSLIYLAPFVAARFLNVRKWWAPFAMGAVPAVPAIMAIAVAWLNSH